MSSLFAAYAPDVSGKPSAEVRGGGKRDDDDDKDDVKQSGSWQAVDANPAAPIQFGTSVALVRDLHSLCCGAIGISGRVFCCSADPKTCPTSHKAKRLEVLEARNATGIYSWTRKEEVVCGSFLGFRGLVRPGNQ